MKNSPLYLLLLLALFFVACDKDDDDLSMDDLPTAAQNYVTTNYPNLNIEEIEQEDLCTGETVYEVELDDDGSDDDDDDGGLDDDDDIELIFDTDGNLLFTVTDVDTDDLPDEVITTLETDYTDYSIDDVEAWTWTDGTVQYEVELEKDDRELEVLISTDGTVICEEEDD